MGTLQRYMGVSIVDGVNTKYGEPRNIVVTFDKNVLIGTEYTYSNIEDISMNLKLNPFTDSDTAYLQKRKLNTASNDEEEVIFDTENHRFTMIIKEDDYDNLDWKTYYICINVQINDLDKMIEIDRKGVFNRTVEIVKDTNRE